MKQIFKYLFSILFILISLGLTAQEDSTATDTSAINTNLIQPRANDLFTTRLSFTVPNPSNNSAFRKSFIGIYQANISMNMALYKSSYIGVTFSNALLQVDKNVIPNITYAKQPHVNFYNAAVKLGGDFHVGDKNRLILSVDVAVGLSFIRFSNFAPKDHTKTIAETNFKSPYAELGLGMVFLVEPHWGFGPTVGYTLIQRMFNPYELYLNDWSGYNNSNSGATQYFSFGFVCHYSFFAK
jgi:hypothetical protein